MRASYLVTEALLMLRGLPLAWKTYGISDAQPVFKENNDQIKVNCQGR
jgi:hypothetical protein